VVLASSLQADSIPYITPVRSMKRKSVNEATVLLTTFLPFSFIYNHHALKRDDGSMIRVFLFMLS
jgi:hypothetical protein